MTRSLQEIATLVGGVVVGDATTRVTTLTAIDDIKPDSLVYADKDNLSRALASDAAALLVSDTTTVTDKPCIQVSRPQQAFYQLLAFFNPPVVEAASIHPTAFIAPDVLLGDNIYIGPYVVIEAGSQIADNCVIKSHVSIGRQVSIGKGTTLYPHVTIYAHSQLGQRVSIHASSVIGSDGFGYQFEDGHHKKVPHVGYVVIEDDVEIGANTVVDRATLGATRIGCGTKIDNLVQVAHSVKLGQHNILCAFTGIAGSSTSGDHVVFAANVGVSDHVKIDSGVILGARTGVPPHKHLRAGNVYLGTPARPKDKAIELELGLTRIPFIRKNLKALAEKVEILSKKIAEQVSD